MQHTATHCNTLQHTSNNAEWRATHTTWHHIINPLQHTATHCKYAEWSAVHTIKYHIFNPLPRTATHCNTQVARSSCRASILEKSFHVSNTLQHTAMYCNMQLPCINSREVLSCEQHAATHCNTLQHTTTLCNMQLPCVNSGEVLSGESFFGIPSFLLFLVIHDINMTPWAAAHQF